MSTTLPAILMLVVGLFTLALAILRRVQSGRSPVVLTYGDDAEGFAGKLFRVIVAALVVHLLAIAAFPQAVTARSSAPAAMNTTPSQFIRLSFSPRKRTPKIATMTIDSLSIGATRAASPSFSARK
jgi:hypothetical protein